MLLLLFVFLAHGSHIVSGATIEIYDDFDGSAWEVNVNEDNSLNLTEGAGMSLTSLCSSLTYLVEDGEVQTTVDTCRDKSAFKKPIVQQGSEGNVIVVHEPIIIGEHSFPTLKQVFSPSGDSFKMWLEADLAGAPFTSNMMAPISSATLLVRSDEAVDPKTILVPFDNDIWSMHQSRSLSTTLDELLPMTSTCVAPFYDDNSRAGVIIGSLEHAVWKTGVSFHAKTGLSENEFGVHELKAFAGLASLRETRDYLEHGWVTSSTESGSLASPKFFVGAFKDWRDGMEAYGRSQIVPRKELPGGLSAPLIGWNSWGVTQHNTTLDDAVSASRAMKKMERNGFVMKNKKKNGYGGSFINFDEVPQLDDDERAKLVVETDRNSQSSGFYMSPWSYEHDDLGSGTLETSSSSCGGNDYKIVDMLKKDKKGEPLKVVDKRIQGTINYAFDPTHPGVLCKALAEIDAALESGFKFVKLDFVNHGAMEGGSRDGEHYLKEVTTGLGAYNYGMERIAERIGGAMVISLSMAPTFPNHFAHSRRVGCDQMYGGVEFSMNQLWGGWWQKETILLDPDLVVLEKNAVFDLPIPDFLKKFVNSWKMDRQSRVNKAVVHGGMIINGDDLTSAQSVESLTEWFGNEDVNAVARLGETFRPVHSPATGTIVRAPPLFELKSRATGDAFLAIFNYSNKPKTGFSVNLSRTVASGTKKFVNVWTGEILAARENILELDVARASSLLLRAITT